MSLADDVPGIVGPEEIGSGGYGRVYRARQPAFDREVAVKILNGRLDDADTLRRFQRECQAIGAVAGHPNIVGVHDAGGTPSGHPFIVMPYLRRGSLSERLRKQGPMPWRQAVQIGVKIAGALHSAHAAGILHRDIKPENILVSEYGEPMLADFGIAQRAGTVMATQTSAALTPAQGAPELMSGDRPSVASDVYSLASTLHTLVRGEPPFVRRGEESVFPMLARIASEPPPDLREHGVPEPVAAVILRGMAKAPHQRQQSALAFGEDLQRAQAAVGVPVTDLPLADRDEDDAAPMQPPAPGTSTPQPPTGPPAIYTTPRPPHHTPQPPQPGTGPRPPQQHVTPQRPVGPRPAPQPARPAPHVARPARPAPQPARPRPTPSATGPRPGTPPGRPGWQGTSGPRPGSPYPQQGYRSVPQGFANTRTPQGPPVAAPPRRRSRTRSVLVTLGALGVVVVGGGLLISNSGGSPRPEPTSYVNDSSLERSLLTANDLGNGWVAGRATPVADVAFCNEPLDVGQGPRGQVVFRHDGDPRSTISQQTAHRASGGAQRLLEAVRSSASCGSWTETQGGTPVSFTVTVHQAPTIGDDSAEYLVTARSGTRQAHFVQVYAVSGDVLEVVTMHTPGTPNSTQISFAEGAARGVVKRLAAGQSSS